MSEKIKNLGWANGWEETPPDVVKCNSLGHVLKDVKSNWSCVTEKYCPICNYYYKIDSSG